MFTEIFLLYTYLAVLTCVKGQSVTTKKYRIQK